MLRYVFYWEVSGDFKKEVDDEKDKDEKINKFRR